MDGKHVHQHPRSLGVLSVSVVKCNEMHQLTLPPWFSFIIMSSNIAGVPSGQIFRHDDAPLYHRGMSILTGLAAFCWLLITVLAVWNRLDRRKKAKASSAV